MAEIAIVGGGLGGLVAAISVAERGGRVILHEARGRLGGRADTATGDYRVNVGPHALYAGPFTDWLRERALLPPVTRPSLTGLRLRADGRVRRSPLRLLPAMRNAGRPAPVERDFRSWIHERLGERAGEAAIGFASLPTFHADPGVLSAAFVQERIARSVGARPVAYVLGGWARLVERLADRARELGVAIETRSKLSELPDLPCIVATDLPAAARLLGEPELLRSPGTRTALFDVAMTPRRGDPTGVLDLDARVYASVYSARDDSVAPARESLVQAMAGVRDKETTEAAQARILETLDAAFRGWRDRVRWERRGVVDGGTGAVDLPGTCWRDRPAVRRGRDRWLVGDRVAAPGVLSEVSFFSARQAGQEVADRLPGRSAA